MPIDPADGALIVSMMMVIIAGVCRLAIQVEKRRLAKLFNRVGGAIYRSCSTCHNGTCSTRTAKSA